MTGQQLKNSILQMAVQGKLVPQDPNDEPASVLLERIRAEKEQLIKEGKIKKEKNPSIIFRGADNLPYEKVGKNEPVCIADEVPFDIPDSWEWVRLGNIGETNIGLTYKPSDKVDAKSGTAVLRSNNIQKGKMDYSDMVYVSCNVPERAMISKGNILICARNGSRALVGKSAIVDMDGMAFGAFMAKYTSLLSGKLNPYILTFIESPVFRCQLDGVKTETINQITQDMIKEQLIPIPPLAEQIRINEKLEELMPYIEKYGAAHLETTKLNETFPDMLKKSILQEAVQGKLIPQDPADEPASVLLERIRAEKEQLIKAGKIKRDKHESVIFRRDNSHYEKLDGIERCIDDEIPFDIPENWVWARFGTAMINRDAERIPLSVNEREKLQKIYDYYGASGVIDKVDRYLFSKPLLLIGEDGANLLTRSKPIAFIANGQYWVNNHAHVIDSSDELLLEYVATYINAINLAPYVTGTAQPKMNQEKMNSILIPIPPTGEQFRIVQKINQIFSVIANM